MVGRCILCSSNSCSILIVHGVNIQSFADYSQAKPKLSTVIVHSDNTGQG